LLLHISLSTLAAIFFSSFLNGWAVHYFKYPLLREVVNNSASPNRGQGQGRGTQTRLPIAAAAMVTFFYLAPAFFISLGIANPVIPERLGRIEVGLVELTMLGLTMIGILRFSILTRSMESHRWLVDSLALASGYGFFRAFHYPKAFNAAMEEAVASFATSGGLSLFGMGRFPLFSQVIHIAFLGTVVAVVVEITWFIIVSLRGRTQKAESFVEPLQDVNRYVELGYFQKNVLAALEEMVRTTISSEGVWEICYLGAFGDNAALLQTIVDSNASWLARTNHSSLDVLSERERTRYLTHSRRVIRRSGMFLLPSGAREGFETFQHVFGFPPGKIAESPHVRYVILNRAVLVECWAAHSKQPLLEPGNTVYASSMYSISRDPSRITRRLKEFQALWGHYLMNNTFSALSSLGDESCYSLLDVIIDRGGSWSVEELVSACKARGIKGLSRAARVKGFLQLLLDSDQISEDAGRFVRDSRLSVWQDRWLRSRSMQRY
jgi:hypothetical protein